MSLRGAGILACWAAAFLGACADRAATPQPLDPIASSPSPAPPRAEVADATYEQVASAYNERAARLQRVWARAVVSVEFTDDEGDRRWEQGEGHFQVIQPSKMALSAGKLGEVILWIGCDGERYWFIDAKEHRRAWVGRHASASRDKIESLGMPAAPRDLLALAGVTAIPRANPDARRNPSIFWNSDRTALTFGGVRGGARWRYTVDPATFEPLLIEVLDSATGEPIVTSDLLEYQPVSIRGDGRIGPRIATRMRCRHHPSGSLLGLSISDMVDGGSNRLREQNFEFESLVDLLSVREVIDVDAPRESAAASAAGDDSGGP